MFSKSAKNVYDMVIGPVEFRKTGYFATWWRFVAREHDLTPKMKVFFRISELRKIRKHPCRSVPGEKMPFNYRKTLKISQEKKILDTTANDGYLTAGLLVI